MVENAEKFFVIQIDESKCINCGKCKRKCPYELDTPELLRKNLEDYKNVLAGKVQV